jgi:hypothetical protein
MQHRKSLKDFPEMPLPARMQQVPAHDQANQQGGNDDEYEDLADRFVEEETGQPVLSDLDIAQLEHDLNADQRQAYGKIKEARLEGRPQVFFIDGPIGTGKTSPMAHRHAFEVVDRCLRDMVDPELKNIIWWQDCYLRWDFRQIPPVVKERREGRNRLHYPHLFSSSISLHYPHSLSHLFSSSISLHYPHSLSNLFSFSISLHYPIHYPFFFILNILASRIQIFELMSRA